MIRGGHYVSAVNPEHGLDVHGSFLELLIELRQEQLEQQRRHATWIA